MLNLSQLVEILFRHKKKIIVCPLVAILLGVLVILYCPRTYRSEAKVFLRVGRETVGLDPTATTGQTMSFQQGDRKDEVKSAIDVLESRDVIAKAVDLVGPDVVLSRAGSGATPPSPWVERLRRPLDKVLAMLNQIDPISDREAAIVRVERKLSVHAERDSTVVNIEFEAKTPQLAQAVCDAILRVYRQEHLRIYRNEESRTFFAQQRDRLRQELDDALETVRSAKSELGLSSIDERCSTLEAHFNAIEQEKYSTEQEFATTKARVADLEGQLAKLPERQVTSQRSIPNQGADLMRDQLYALQMKAMDLEARYSDSHPLVQTIKQQLEDAKQVVADQSDQRSETIDAVNPIHRELSLELKRQRNTLAGCEARLAELQQQRDVVMADLRHVNEVELKIDKLQRQADLSRDKYFQYAKNLEEARMDNELEAGKISNVSVLQPATFAERPVSPNKLLVALASLVLATAGTAALVFASETFNDRLRTDSEVAETLGVPVLGTIPNGRRFERVFRTPTNGNKPPQPKQLPVSRS